MMGILTSSAYEKNPMISNDHPPANGHIMVFTSSILNIDSMLNIQPTMNIDWYGITTNHSFGISVYPMNHPNVLNRWIILNPYFVRGCNHWNGCVPRVERFIPWIHPWFRIRLQHIPYNPYIHHMLIISWPYINDIPSGNDCYIAIANGYRKIDFSHKQHGHVP